MAGEIPFNAAQRTWECADIIVCGTPEIPYDPSTEIVIAATAAWDPYQRRWSAASIRHHTQLPN